MMGIEGLIHLLERKNLCYRSFHKLCCEFTDEISRGDISQLEQFQKKRASLLRVLDHLETEVRDWLNAYNECPENLDAIMTQEAKEQIALIFKEKDGTVRSILDLDLQILGQIDRIKDETIQKLQAVQSSRKSIGAYRSPAEQVEKAEERKLLDREA